MTKLYNDPTNFRVELIEGFVAAYGRLVQRCPTLGRHGRGRPARRQGHADHRRRLRPLPGLLRLRRAGLADAAVMGNVFAAPSSEQIYRVTRAAAGERGVLYCYGNYSGDVLNFDMARRAAERERAGRAHRARQ